MRVPFYDLSAMHAEVARPLDAAVSHVIRDGRFANGPAVESFERAFAGYVNSYNCIGVNSGTAALHLALAAADVGAGDEVITTPMSWIATAWAISYVGATPVFVDVDESYNLDPKKVEEAITDKTKAIVPVHLYGRAADVDRLQAIARRENLIMIEDAAQAHGTRIGKTHAGTIGKMGCFSFYPGKNLGALGEAGAIVTDDHRLAKRLRALRDHAQASRHEHVELGYNARMDSIQGAALQVKLAKLDKWNAARKKLADHYIQSLRDVKGIVVPSREPLAEHSWHLFVVRCRFYDRDRIREKLEELEIGAAVHYPRLIPFQPAYAHLDYKEGDFPIAEELARTCLSLPMFPHMTREQAMYVSGSLQTLVAMDD